MIIPISLYIKDFLSFQEQEIDFKKGVTTCVMGRNLTEDDQESNGSGKSAFQSAVELAITGGISRKINKAKMVRWGTEEANIIMKLYDNQTHETIVINRTIPSKGSEVLEILEGIDDELKPVKFPTVKDGNEWIEKRLKIARQDISNYFIVNEVNYVSFFNSPDLKKKELISRFSNADIIDPVFNVIDKKFSEESEKVVLKEREILKQETIIETIQENLVNEEGRNIEEEKKEFAEIYNRKIISEELDIKSYNEDIHILNNTLTELNDVFIPGKKTSVNSLKQRIKEFIKTVKEEEFDKLRNEAKSVENKKRDADKAEDSVRNLIREINSDISKTELILEGEVECPKCKFHFNPIQIEVSIEESKKNLIAFKKELEEAKADLLKVNEIKSKFVEEGRKVDLKISSLNEKNDKINRQKRGLNEELNRELKELNSLENEVSSIESRINIFKDKIKQSNELIEKYRNIVKEELKSDRFKTKENELKKRLKAEKEVLLKLEEENQQLISKSNNIKSWSVNFKLFKSYLANKKLKIIQDMINKYLHDMGSSYKLKLEGYKQLANKEIREKITPYIFKDGEIRDYGEFSKGERVRIDFATLITLQSLVNESTESGGLDLLMCDEVMEGLDSAGLSSILESFNKTKKTSFITTHVTNENMYEHILMVEKINGISKVN